MQQWLAVAEKVDELKSIPLVVAERISQLPSILRRIIARLRESRDMGTNAKYPPAAVEHGVLRYFQGYSAPLIVHGSF